MSGTLIDGNFVSTIKPSGGGDFTTLALWEDYVDDDPQSLSHAGYWAECYKGGNLGAVTLGGWSDAGTTTRYPKIYAASGESHAGDISDGAYIQAATPLIYIEVDYVRLDGIRIKCTNPTSTAVDFVGYNGNQKGPVVDNNFIHGDFAIGVAVGAGSSAGGSTTINTFIRNNIVQIGGSGSDAKYGLVSEAIKSHTVNSWVQNNTVVVDSDATGSAYIGIVWAYKSGNVLTLYLENNYSSCEGVTGTDYSSALHTDGTLNLNASNNAQNDSSGSLIGSDSSLLSSLSNSDVFTSPSTSDYSIKSGSVLIDAGKTPTSTGLSHISVSDADILGYSRAQFASYDIGAFEFLEDEAIVYSTNGGPDVINEIIVANPMLQGGISIFSGPLNFEKKNNTVAIHSQVGVNRLDHKFVQSDGER